MLQLVTLPSALSGLVMMSDLNLSGVGILAGPLPPELANLSSLAALALDGVYNGTAAGALGALPPAWSAFTGVQALQLRDMRVIGALPRESKNHRSQS